MIFTLIFHSHFATLKFPLKHCGKTAWLACDSFGFILFESKNEEDKIKCYLPHNLRKLYSLMWD